MSNMNIAFTDGASRGNPGPGGWASIVVSGEKVTELGGAEQHTTNNRMEMMAAIKALEFLSADMNSTTIYTDSSYLKRGVTLWISKWEEQGWKTQTKKELLNKDLWQKLSQLIKGRQIEWKLLSGHVGIAGNERVDVIATDFALGRNLELYSGPINQYSIDVKNVSYDEKAQEKKSSSRSRSRAKAYSYISLVNGEVKIHQTWQECEKRVKGVPGALYKKALSPLEEQIVMEEYRRKAQ